MVTRYVKASIGSTSATMQVDVEAPPTNPDFGTNLRSWILQPGGQTLVLPNRTYSMSSIAAGTAGAVHNDWLILKAQTPGQAFISAAVQLAGVTKVMFVGFRFDQRFYVVDNACDRLVTWYCEHSNPYGNGLSNNTRPGIFINGGTNLCFMGADIHACTKDGIHMSTGANASMRAQGVRIWDINDPDGEDHNDALQVRGGQFAIDDYVFGLDPNGVPSGNGHSQIESDIAAINGAFRRGWNTQSGNFGFTVGGPSPANVELTDIHQWDNGFAGGPNSSGGANLTMSSFNNAAPGSGSTAPDVAWRAANPYGSHAAWLAGSGL